MTTVKNNNKEDADDDHNEAENIYLRKQTKNLSEERTYEIKQKINKDHIAFSRNWKLEDNVIYHRDFGYTSFTPWLEIKPSGLGEKAGKGLFAKTEFEAGEVIGFYSGKHICIPKYAPELNNSYDALLEIENVEYKTTQYWQGPKPNRLRGPVVVDGRHGTTGYLQYSNHAPDSDKRCNCIMTNDQYLVAKRRIKEDEEILWDYGDGYWAAKKHYEAEYGSDTDDEPVWKNESGSDTDDEPVWKKQKQKTFKQLNS